jgi:radical SAM superfamily enzyme YgiQ (UPF0313 family)
MKILLINPTIDSEPESLNLGLVSIGSFLLKNTHHTPRILDFAFSRKAWKKRLIKEIEHFSPDIVGIYISSPFFPSAVKIASEIKKIDPGLKILAGGHHPTVCPDDVIGNPHIDMINRGEGEFSIIHLLDGLEQGGVLSNIPGIWWKDGSEIHRCSAPGTILPLKQFPFLEWNLYDSAILEKTFFLWGVLPMMASRGCPYRCSFCTITNIHNLYSGQNFLRYRDPVTVVDEIEYQFNRYRHYGLRLVYFYDLNFLFNYEWISSFIGEYKKRGLHRNIPWSAFTRADHVNEKTLEILDDSGCVNLRVGIESANDHMRMVVYKKNIPKRKLLETVSSVKRQGITVTGYFIVGGPGEKPEWLFESLFFAFKTGIEYPVFFLFKPLPHTKILEIAPSLGSRINLKSLKKAGGYLKGINLIHEHIGSLQIGIFFLGVQILFGARIILDQLRREGVLYFSRMIRYAAHARRQGFSLHESVVYYVFYGYDHLVNPPRFPLKSRVGLLWYLWIQCLYGFIRLLGFFSMKRKKPLAACSPAPWTKDT